MDQILGLDGDQSDTSQKLIVTGCSEVYKQYHSTGAGTSGKVEVGDSVVGSLHSSASDYTEQIGQDSYRL